jgi:hypothetical protein
MIWSPERLDFAGSETAAVSEDDATSAVFSF